MGAENPRTGTVHKWRGVNGHPGRKGGPFEVLPACGAPRFLTDRVDIDIHTARLACGRCLNLVGAPTLVSRAACKDCRGSQTLTDGITPCATCGGSGLAPSRAER